MMTRTQQVLVSTDDYSVPTARIFTNAEEPFNVSVNIDPAYWEQMGSPATITVTIEPGDKLNGGS